MRIKSDKPAYQNIQFTSKCCPIKPFTITTKLGDIKFEELPVENYTQKGFLKNMVDFFCYNFARNTTDPQWLKFQNIANLHEFMRLKSMFRHEYCQVFKNDRGHLTLLVAKNQKDEVCGACLSYGFDEVPNTRNTTLYIDSIAVDKKYRGLNIGKILLEKSVEAGKDFFTDVFLHGEKLAGGFYDRLGFKTLNPKNTAQKKVIDYIAQDRFDYPEHISLYTRPIQPDKPRWYKLAAKAIDKERRFYGD